MTAPPHPLFTFARDRIRAHRVPVRVKMMGHDGQGAENSQARRGHRGEATGAEIMVDRLDLVSEAHDTKTASQRCGGGLGLGGVGWGGLERREMDPGGAGGTRKRRRRGREEEEDSQERVDSRPNAVNRRGSGLSSIEWQHVATTSTHRAEALLQTDHVRG